MQKKYFDATKERIICHIPSSRWYRERLKIARLDYLQEETTNSENPRRPRQYHLVRTREPLKISVENFTTFLLKANRMVVSTSTSETKDDAEARNDFPSGGD